MQLSRYRRYGRFGGVAAAAGRWAGKRVRSWMKGSSSNTRSKKRVRRSVNSKSKRVRSSKKFSPEVNFDGAGGSHSMVRHRVKCRKGPLRGLMKQTNKNIYSYTSTMRMTSSLGVQGTFLPNILFTGADLNSVIQALAASTAAGYKSSKCLIHSGYSESKYTNQEKGNVELVLYDIIPKRDVTAAGVAGNYDVLSSWNVGLNDVTYASNSSSPSTAGKANLGSTPFDSVLFCQYYTVIKKTKVMLSQGSTHIHRVRSLWNGMLNHTYTEEYTYLRGKSVITLAVVNGMPLNDQTTKTNIAVGAAAVDVVTVTRIVYQGYINNLFTYSFGDNQQSVATPYVMDEGSGEPEADAAA